MQEINNDILHYIFLVDKKYARKFLTRSNGKRRNQGNPPPVYMLIPKLVESTYICNKFPFGTDGFY